MDPRLRGDDDLKDPPVARLCDTQYVKGERSSSRDQSTFAPEALTTFAHFSVS
jgi:hypothetical protein